IQKLTEEALGAPRGEISPEQVYGFYAGALEQIDPSPQAMFLAFAMTDDTQVSDTWTPVELFAALDIDVESGSALASLSVRRHANNDNASPEDRLGFEPLVRGL